MKPVVTVIATTLLGLAITAGLLLAVVRWGDCAMADLG